MKDKTKRTLRMKFKDGTYTDMQLTVATKINVDLGMFHVDKVKNGYRLTISQDFIDDMTQFDCLEMIRED
jgi:hypothetical protein